MFKKILIAAALSTPLFASASVVFSDNFESLAAPYSTGLNWSAAGTPWTVGNGTVDLIGAGSSWNFVPAFGKYVDLDGSSGKAGVFSTTLNLNAGVTYNLTFALAGNQRGGSDAVEVLFGGAALQSFTRTSSAGFTTESILFTPSASQAFTLSFHNLGGDNVGALLDNVSVASVPEPQTYALLIAGLAAMGMVSRRRKQAQR